MNNPVFQHRHYKAIAAVIAEMSAEGFPATTDHLVMKFGDLFAGDNDRFSPERFDAACRGKPSNGRDKVRS